jgi:hypothetical protein
MQAQNMKEQVVKDHAKQVEEQAKLAQEQAKQIQEQAQIQADQEHVVPQAVHQGEHLDEKALAEHAEWQRKQEEHKKELEAQLQALELEKEKLTHQQ